MVEEEAPEVFSSLPSCTVPNLRLGGGNLPIHTSCCSRASSGLGALDWNQSHKWVSCLYCCRDLHPASAPASLQHIQVVLQIQNPLVAAEAALVPCYALPSRQIST